MVDSISANSSFMPPEIGLNAQRAERSLSEARRLLALNQLSGQPASRLTSLMADAEQSIEQGDAAEAQRIAREALRFAREVTGETPAIMGEPTEEPAEDTAARAGESNEEGSGSNSAANPGQPLNQRETTTYQDGSDDSGISFQAPQPLTNLQAPLAVRQHELSHVSRETRDAILNGQRVMASVTVHQRIDPATGEVVVDGGNARTVIFPNIEDMMPQRTAPQSRGNRFDQTG